MKMVITVNRIYILRQFDVNNVFLQLGELKETVFVARSQGFTYSEHPEYVCHLNKVIYGLKQGPKAWYTRLSIAF